MQWLFWDIVHKTQYVKLFSSLPVIFSDMLGEIGHP
jgi:hypothetical protein